jgi:hypothetical protein
MLVLLLFFMSPSFLGWTQSKSKFSKVSTKWGVSAKPSTGFVPDETTAVRIAEAVLEGLYGPDKTRNEQPYTASLVDGIWVVRGTVQHGKVGGAAVLRISKNSGTILFFINEQ